MTTVLDLHEWEECSPVTTPALAGQSFDAAPSSRSLAERMTLKDILHVTELRNGLTVTATSYVGRVALGALQITVRPKIDVDILRTLLRYAYGLRNLATFAGANQALQAGTFQDLLIVQLAAEVTELEARGLHRSYVPQEEMLAAPRGRIDLQRMAQQGGVISASLPCRHHPRLEDTPPNQILLAGLRLAARLTDDLLLRTRLRRLAARMAEHVSVFPLTAKSLAAARRRLNRMTAAYEPAFDLIALLLEGTGVSLEDAEQSLALPGFLFDMNLFFEALLTRFLTTNLPGCQVHSQFRLRDMMRYLPEANPLHRQAPTPRPDIVIRQGGKTVAMLDTKYRDLWNKPLPRDMLYQLAIYALSRDQVREATILYPSTGGMQRDQVIEIREPTFGSQRARVILRAVDLPRLAAAIEMRGIYGDRNRQAMAARLAFDA
jgi:5-methylcytosine-specific restriction enzyme subunit McrC